MSTKYIIFDSKLKAEQISYEACEQKQGRIQYKWSYLYSNDETKSLLRLNYKADYTDILGEVIVPKCEYNDFKELYKKTDYIETDILTTEFIKPTPLIQEP